MYSLLAAKTRGLEAEALAFTQQLIRTPSPRCTNMKWAQLVEERMRAIGYENVHIDDYGNVVGVLPGRQGEPTLLLSSHMDTAGEGQPEAWQESPYSGEVRDGVLYGLGASDCKAGLVAQIYAGGLLRRALLPLKGNLVVAATVSEEQGGSPGLRHLMQDTLPSLDLRPDFAILAGRPAWASTMATTGRRVQCSSKAGQLPGQRRDERGVRELPQPVSGRRLRWAARIPELALAAFPHRPGSENPESASSGDARTETVSGDGAAQARGRAAAASVARCRRRGGAARGRQLYKTHHHPGTADRGLVAGPVSPVDYAGAPRWRPPVAMFVRQIRSRLGMGTAGGDAGEPPGVPATPTAPLGDTCHGPNESVSVARKPGDLRHGDHTARGGARLRLDAGRDRPMNILDQLRQLVAQVPPDRHAQRKQLSAASGRSAADRQAVASYTARSPTAGNPRDHINHARRRAGGVRGERGAMPGSSGTGWSTAARRSRITRGSTTRAGRLTPART